MESFGFGKTLQVLLRIKGKHLVALILAPSVLILLLGLLFGTGLKTASIAVYNQDQGFEMPGMGLVSIPQQLLSGLDKSVFKIINADSEDAAFRLVKEGKASIALSFPTGLTEELMIKLDDPAYMMKVKIRLSLDTANPLVTALTAAKIGSALKKNAQGFNLEQLPLPVDLSTLHKNGLPNMGAFILPGVLLLILYIISIMATTAVTRELKQEEHGLVTGKPNGAFILIFTLVLSLQALLLFLTGVWIFQVTIPGNVILGALSVLGLIFCGAAFGTLFTTILKRSEVLPRAVMMAILPIFFSGVLLPLELLPGWLRWICYFMPPYYAVQSFRVFTLYQMQHDGAWLMLTALFTIGLVLTAAAITAKPKSAVH